MEKADRIQIQRYKSYEKIVGQAGFISQSMTTSLGEGKTEFKPAVLRSEIDLVSHLAYSKSHQKNW